MWVVQGAAGVQHIARARQRRRDAVLAQLCIKSSTGAFGLGQQGQARVRAVWAGLGELAVAQAALGRLFLTVMRWFPRGWGTKMFCVTGSCSVHGAMHGASFVTAVSQLCLAWVEQSADCGW